MTQESVYLRAGLIPRGWEPQWTEQGHNVAKSVIQVSHSIIQDLNEQEVWVSKGKRRWKNYTAGILRPRNETSEKGKRYFFPFCAHSEQRVWIRPAVRVLCCLDALQSPRTYEIFKMWCEVSVAHENLQFLNSWEMGPLRMCSLKSISNHTALSKLQSEPI